MAVGFSCHIKSPIIRWGHLTDPVPLKQAKPLVTLCRYSHVFARPFNDPNVKSFCHLLSWRNSQTNGLYLRTCLLWYYCFGPTQFCLGVLCLRSPWTILSTRIFSTHHYEDSHHVDVCRSIVTKLLVLKMLWQVTPVGQLNAHKQKAGFSSIRVWVGHNFSLTVMQNLPHSIKGRPRLSRLSSAVHCSSPEGYDKIVPQPSMSIMLHVFKRIC